MVLRLCNMFFCSSFNHFALLLNFVCFSQILFQNYSTSFLVGVSLAVMLLPLKSPYTGFVLLLNLLWITCLTWVTARKTVFSRLWNIMERLKRPGKYYLYIKLLKIPRFWNIIERSKRPGKYYLYIKLLKIPRFWNIIERSKRPGKYYLYIKLLKTNLASLKTKVDKLDIDKFSTSSSWFKEIKWCC